MIALNAEAKITRVADLLARHRDDRVIIFAEYTELVYAISRRLLVPAITYQSSPQERRTLIEGFRSGRYSKLVTGRVLNEGVDLPDANVAIVASGSSARTSEAQASRRRRPKEARHRAAMVWRKPSRGAGGAD